MTGGAFKNSSNLLARRREVEELETKTNRLLQEIAQIKNRREDLLTAIELNEEDLEQVKETLQKEFNSSEYCKDQCGSCNAAEK